MARVQTRLIVGKTEVATESRHLLGPGEGTWWKFYSWWVIPLAIMLFVWPGRVTRSLPVGGGMSGAGASVPPATPSASSVKPSTPVPPVRRTAVPTVPTSTTINLEVPGLEKLAEAITSRPSSTAPTEIKVGGSVEVKSPPSPPPTPPLTALLPSANVPPVGTGDTLTPEEQRQYDIWHHK